MEIPLNGVRGAAIEDVYGLALTAGRPEGAFAFEIDDVRLE